MDEKPPAKVMVSARVLPKSRDLIDAWAVVLHHDRSAQVARMLAYAARHMPLHYDPKHDLTPIVEIPCETPTSSTSQTTDPGSSSPSTSRKQSGPAPRASRPAGTGLRR